MIIAGGAVWIWRQIRATEYFANNLINGVFAVHLLLIALGLYYRVAVIDAAKWVYENFLGAGKVQEPFVFYGIVFLSIAAFAAWIIFLLDLRRSNETFFREPVDLTWGRLRDGLGKQTDLLL